MSIAKIDSTTEEMAIVEASKAADLSRETFDEAPGNGPRIALLTPYSGHNLGDAAIQDAMIANLRLRLPGAQFSGVSLNCDNFLERHASGSFPLCGPARPRYHMVHGTLTDQPGNGQIAEHSPDGTKLSRWNELKCVLRQVPVLWPCLKNSRAFVRSVCGELHHSVRAYRFLRTQDLLVVSGGGQLDEEWGGPWGHPFALFKWAVLARAARVPYAIASVGACKINSGICRIFIRAALQMAQYRSFRDRHSRAIAAGLLPKAAGDPVVPDLAFSLLPSELPAPAERRSRSHARPVVALSPIAYAKPGCWVYQDAALFDRYLSEMARVASQLLQRDYRVVMVWSGVGDDDRVVPEILERLDHESKRRAESQLQIPRIRTWKDLAAALRDVDFLIASRLHSTILGFVMRKPTVAISFDPKVDWVMEDVGQTQYLLQIRDFRAEDVLDALDRIQFHRDVVQSQIDSYLETNLSVSRSQYDSLACLALSGRRSRA